MLTRSFVSVPQQSSIFVCYDCLRKQLRKRLERQTRWSSGRTSTQSHFSSPGIFDFTKNISELVVDSKDDKLRIENDKSPTSESSLEKTTLQPRRVSPTRSRRRTRPLRVRKCFSTGAQTQEVSNEQSHIAPTASKSPPNSKGTTANSVSTVKSSTTPDAKARRRKLLHSTRSSIRAAKSVADHFGISETRAQTFPKILQLVNPSFDGTHNDPKFTVKDHIPKSLLQELGLDKAVGDLQSQGGQPDTIGGFLKDSHQALNLIGRNLQSITDSTKLLQDLTSRLPKLVGPGNVSNTKGSQRSSSPAKQNTQSRNDEPIPDRNAANNSDGPRAEETIPIDDQTSTIRPKGHVPPRPRSRKESSSLASESRTPRKQTAPLPNVPQDLPETAKRSSSSSPGKSCRKVGFESLGQTLEKSLAPIRTVISQPSEGDSADASLPPPVTLRPRGRGADKTASDIQQISSQDLQLTPLEVPQPPVPSLAHDLQRVLFNPGIYQLQDPRSRVFNFDPYLQNITPVADFNFKALKDYIVSSEDDLLRQIAAEHGAKYFGSTSSMTSVLTHFHYLISQWRPINVQNLSQGFTDSAKTFTAIGKSPAAVFLVHKDGSYAIDADKEYASSSILMELGKSLEKFLTLPPEKYERYKKTDEFGISEEERKEPESYHYTRLGDFMMRSQLDAHDSRLPGTGMFDLKTRAVVSIRMNPRDHDSGMGYQISDRFGNWQSYEREYFDMIRSAFLKYSLQVRMGRMDGIFVAYHNVERIFGFQYVSLPEMDLALHGQSSTRIGDAEFKFSLKLWNEILERATEKFPGQSLRLHFETREAVVPFMYIFAEPVTDEEIEDIQSKNQEEIEEMTRKFHDLENTEPAEQMGSEESLTIDNDDQDTSATEESDISSEQEAQSHIVTTDTEVSDLLSLDSSADDFDGLDIQASHDDSLGPLELNPIVDDHPVVPEDSIPVLASEEVNIEDSSHTFDIAESVAVLELNPLADVEDDIQAVSSEMAFDANHEALDFEASDPASSSPSLDASPSAPSLDSESNPSQDSDSDSSSAPKKPILGFTLVVRNLVNYHTVQRPNSLSASDTWTLEYNLSELKESQTHALYHACQRRRKKAQDFSEDQERAATIAQRRQENPAAVTDDFWTSNSYMRKIGEMVKLGRRRRKRELSEERERRARGEGIKILYPHTARGGVNDHTDDD